MQPLEPKPRSATDLARPAPTIAMVLAAGKGLRLRPLTETTPKPLVEVAGRTLIDRVIDRLVDAGVRRVVVNVHYLGEHIERHLDDRNGPEIHFSRESELLETGGGVRHALPHLGPGPFWVANGDVLWLDGPHPALARLARLWDDRQMDALLLLHATVDAYGYGGPGDFVIDPLGRLARRPEHHVVPYLFTGVQILHPRLFEGMPAGAYSLNVLYDRAMAEGRLYGAVHDGEWFHVGTPEARADAERFLNARYAGRQRR